MLDDNWELINGPAAHEIEVLNYANQVNVIEALIRFFAFHTGVGPEGTPIPLNTQALKELHRTGTLFLLQSPGTYRTTPVHVGYAGGEVIYQPPAAEAVEGHMIEFEQLLQASWAERTPVEIAALALWRLNWVHPFKNGNGRTARAFAYALMCMKFGFVLPGAPTVLEQLTGQDCRPEYYKALRHADLSLEQTGQADLGPMCDLVERLLEHQLRDFAAAPAEAAQGGTAGAQAALEAAPQPPAEAAPANQDGKPPTAAA